MARLLNFQNIIWMRAFSEVFRWYKARTSCACPGYCSSSPRYTYHEAIGYWIASPNRSFRCPIRFSYSFHQTCSQGQGDYVPPHGWNKHTVLAPDHTIVLQIGL